MKAAVFHKANEIRIEEKETPSPDAGEVIVEVMAAGICGSDVCFYQEGRIGGTVIKSPLILGHECSGRVAQSRSERFEPGDRVVIEPGFPCGTCGFCTTGNYNLCQDMEFLGTYPKDGTFAEYVAAPEDRVFRIPDNMSFQEAALVEPTAVAIQGVRRGRVNLGETVTIIGAGSIGLLVLQVARAAGASRVYMTDLEELRLRKAKSLGADEALNPAKEDAIEKIVELTHNQGVDVSLEAVGSGPTINQAIRVARPGGRVVVIGTGKRPELEISVHAMISKELDLVGVWRYLRAFPTALSLISQGSVRPRAIITHELSFERIEEGLSLAAKKGEAIKVVLVSKP